MADPAADDYAAIAQRMRELASANEIKPAQILSVRQCNMCSLSMRQDAAGIWRCPSCDPNPRVEF